MLRSVGESLSWGARGEVWVGLGSAAVVGVDIVVCWVCECGGDGIGWGEEEEVSVKRE